MGVKLLSFIFAGLLAFSNADLLHTMYHDTSITVNDVWTSEDQGEAVFTAVYNMPAGKSTAGMTGFYVRYSTRNGGNLIGNGQTVGDAQRDFDYVGTNGRIDFGINDLYNGAMKFFTISVINDNIVETTETFNVDLYHDNGVVWHDMGLNNGRPIVVTIDDDERASINVETAVATEGENGRFTFNVRLSHLTSTQTCLKYETVRNMAGGNGRASSVQDYEYTTGVVKLNSQTRLSDSLKFYVPVINDNVQESEETFEVLLSLEANAEGCVNSQKYFLEGNGRVQGRFLPEVEGVQVTVLDDEKEEGEGQFVFTVRMSHMVDTDVNVYVKTRDGDAIMDVEGLGNPAVAQQHYLPVPQRRVTFPRASMAVQLGTGGSPDLEEEFTVTIINDNIQSPNAGNTDEYLWGRREFYVDYRVDPAVSIKSSGGADNVWDIATTGVKTSGVASGFLYDDEGATMYISDAYTSPQIQGSTNEAADTWTFNVELSHGVSGWRSASGADFIYSLGEGNAQIGDENKPAWHDDLFAPSASMPCGRGRDSNGAFDPENPNRRWIPVSNFARSTQTLVFNNAIEGGDELLEPTETFEVIIERGPNSEKYGIEVARDTGVGTIYDDDIGSWTVTHRSPPVFEEGVDTMILFTVTLSHFPDEPVTLGVDTRDLGQTYKAATGTTEEDVEDTPTHTQDYFHLGGYTLTFEDMDNSMRTKEHTVTVSLLNDNVQEQTEQFRVTFDAPQPDNLNWSPSARNSRWVFPVIEDDEAVTVSMGCPKVPEYEEDVLFPEGFHFTATLSHEIATPISVDWQTVDHQKRLHRATQGVDFEYQTGTLRFEEGDLSQTFIVSGLDDWEQEGTSPDPDIFDAYLETFSVEIIITTASPPLLKNVAPFPTCLATFWDNERATLVIEDAEADEGEKLSFEVSLSHRHPLNTIRAHYSTADCEDCESRAGAGGNTDRGSNDYVPATNNYVDIPAGTTLKTITVSTKNDNVQEDTEGFSIIISAVDGLQQNDPDAAENWQAVGYITDDEQMRLNIADSSASESKGSMIFTVTATHKADQSVAYGLNIVGGTAEVNVDFDGSDPQEKFAVMPPFTTRTTVSVDLHNDNVQENIEQFFVGIKSSSMVREYGDLRFDNQVATGSIIDFEDATISIEDVSDSESNTDFQFAVSLSHEVVSGVRVEWNAAASGTARPQSGTAVGGDFYEQFGTVAFLADETEAHISVKVIDDFIGENPKPETFLVHLQDIILPAETDFTVRLDTTSKTAVGTITDDDAVVICLENARATDERDNLVFRVHMSHSVDTDVSVFFSTTELSLEDNPNAAIDPLHYSTTTRTVTFQRNTGLGAEGGPPPVEIVVPLVNDDLVNPIRILGAVMDSLKPSNWNIQLANCDDLETLGDSATAFGEIADTEGQLFFNDDNLCPEGEVCDFAITSSHGFESDLTVEWSTADRTALSDPPAGVDQDYESNSGTLTFLAGEKTSQPFQITILADETLEVDEQFDINFVADTSYFSVADPAPVAGIIPGAQRPPILVKAAPECSEASGICVFDVCIPQRPASAVEVHWAHSPHVLNEHSHDTHGDAVNDWPADDMGFVTFTDQDTVTVDEDGTERVWKQFTVTLVNDEVHETHEWFEVYITEVTNPNRDTSAYPFQGGVSIFDISESKAVAVILNDDFATLTVTDGHADEGGENMFFEVTLSHQVYKDVVVHYETSEESASGCADPFNSQPDSNHECDYLTVRAVDDRKVQFLMPDWFAGAEDEPGTRTQSIQIQINNDNIQEEVETFTLYIKDLAPVVRPTEEDAPEYIAWACDTCEHEDGTVGTGPWVNFHVQDGEDFVSCGLPFGSGAECTVTGYIHDPEGAFVETTSVETSETAGSVTFTVELTHAADKQFSVTYTTMGLTEEELEALATDDHSYNSADEGDFVSATGTFAFAAGEKGSATSRTLVVNLLNDNILEGEEVFQVKYSDFTHGGYAGSGGFAYLVDDDEGATITLLDDMFYETDGTMNARVQLSHAPDHALVYAFSTDLDQSTASETDFTAVSGEVVFPANPESEALLTQTIQIPILDDNVQENTEFIAVSMVLQKPAADKGYEIPTSFVGSVPLYDREGTEITINDASTNEGMDMEFVVDISHEADADIYFEFETIEGTAHAWTDPSLDLRGNTDYRPNGAFGNVFTMPAGQKQDSFFIIISNDAIQEGTETFQVSVVEHNGSLYDVAGTSDPSGYNIAFTSTTATGSIIDKEGCFIMSDVQSQNEIVPQMVFNLRMSHILDQDIIVSYETVDGTGTATSDGATVGEDFRAKSGEITFAGLANNFPVYKVTVDIIDDEVQERDENVHISFTSYRPVVQDRDYFIDIDQDAVGVLINDVENPTLEIKPSSGSEGNVFSFPIVLSHAVSHDVQVRFQTNDCGLELGQDGNPVGKCAIAGVDYEDSMNAVATVRAGSKVGDAYVVIINDQQVEFDDEFFSVTVSDVDVDGFGLSPSYIVTMVDQATGTIVHSDENAFLEVSDESGEEGDTLFFTVTLTHGTDRELPVEWVVEGVDNPDMSFDVDESTMSGTIVFAPSTLRNQQITVPILLADDNVVEATEEFHLRVFVSEANSHATHNHNPISVNLRNGGRGTGTITDDDTASFTIGEGAGDESEGVKFPIVYAGNGWVEDEVIIEYHVEFLNEPGAATAADFLIGEDVTNRQAVSLTERNDFLVIPLRNDNVQGRVAKPFKLILDSFNLANIDKEGRVTMNTIEVNGVANDFEGTSVYLADVTLEETAGSVTLDVLLSHRTNAPVRFTIGLDESGTALEGTDFRWTTRDSGFFATNSQNPVPLNVEILNDDVQERDETFGFFFNIVQEAPGFEGAVGDGHGVVTISDFEDASISISDVTWSEDLSPALRFTVELSHDLSEPVTLPWTAVAIDTQPEDLRDGRVIPNGVVTLQGKSTYTFDAGFVVNDFLQEPDEHVDATINGATWATDGTTAPIVAQGTGRGTIASGEVGAAVEIFDAEAREGSTLRFTVTLTHQPASRLVLRYSTLSGSADGSKDFFGTTSGEMAFEAGELETTILVKSNPDIWFEGDETFTVSLTNLAPFPEVPTTAIGTIREDEGAIFTVSDASVSEGDDITFTVSLDKQTDEPMIMTYMVDEGAGGNAADIRFNGAASHTVAARSPVPTTWTFSATALNDNLVERSAETCNVRVVTPTGFKSTGGYTVIADGDFGLLTVTLAETIEEGNGDVEFTITMDLDSDVDTSFFVNVNTLPSGVSLDGLPDFVPLNRNVQFDGVRMERESVTVQIIGDSLVELDEQLTTLVTFVDMDAYSGLRVNSGGRFTTIVNDDDVAFLHAVPAFGTEGSGEVVFVVELSQPVDADVSFSYFVTDGENDPSEIVGDRSQEGVMFGTMTILAGQTSTSMSVEIGDDDITEGPETFEVLFHGINSNRRGVVWDEESRDLVRDDGTGGAGHAIGTIVDDDIATMSARLLSGGQEVDNIAFVVDLDNEIQAGLSIMFSYVLQSGSATGAGGDNVFADFRPLGSTNGVYTGTPIQFAVQVIDDNMCEDTETFSIVLENLPEWVRPGPPVVATITDDDSCNFSITSQTCSEVTPRGVSSCVVDIGLSGGVGAAGGRTQNFATIDVRKSDITTDRNDFANGMFTNDVFTATFSPADLEVKSVPIMMLNDELAEGVEQFSLSLENPRFNGRASQRITASAGSVVISVEDDPADVAVMTFTEISQEAEEGQSLTYTLSLSHRPQRSFTFNVNAGADANDVIFANPYTVPAMATTTSFTFQTVDDGTIEGTETVSLFVVPESVGRSPTTPGTVVIRDNDSYNILEKCKTVYKARGQVTTQDFSGCFIGDRFAAGSIQVSNTPGISINNGVVTIEAGVSDIQFVISVPSGVSFAVQVVNVFGRWGDSGPEGPYVTGTQGASFLAAGEICPSVGDCCTIQNGGIGELTCTPDAAGVRVSFKAPGAGTETVCVGQDGTCIEIITEADPYITQVSDQATVSGSDIVLTVRTTGEGVLEFQDFDSTGPVQSPIIAAVGPNTYQVTLRTVAGRAGSEIIALTVNNAGERHDSTWFTVTVFGVCN